MGRPNSHSDLKYFSGTASAARWRCWSTTTAQCPTVAPFSPATDFYKIVVHCSKFFAKFWHSNLGMSVVLPIPNVFAWFSSRKTDQIEGEEEEEEEEEGEDHLDKSGAELKEDKKLQQQVQSVQSHQQNQNNKKQGKTKGRTAVSRKKKKKKEKKKGVPGFPEKKKKKKKKS